MNTRARTKLRVLQGRRITENKWKAGKVNIECNTRTVELPGTGNIGDERSKLAFMLAIGLVPKPETKSHDGPLVRIGRLDPEIESKARIKTKEAILEIFKNRYPDAQLLNHQTLEDQRHRFKSSECNPAVEPIISSSLPGAVQVEGIHLISSDEEPDQNQAPVHKAPGNSGGPHTRTATPAIRKRSACQRNASESLRKLNASSIVRKSVFKLLNNQEGGGGINRKSKSTTRKANVKKSEGLESPSVSSLKQPQSNNKCSLKPSVSRGHR